METNHKIIITPRTKIFELIEAYPTLEDILIQYVPAFKKLKNPVLRRTIAKVATLQQAAAIGNVKVEELVNTLRKHVGQDLMEINEMGKYVTEKPSWFRAEAVVKELDARDMLARGEHPVNQVIADLKTLKESEIYKLVVPFLAAPLVDKAISLGYKHWIHQVSDEWFEIYFAK